MDGKVQEISVLGNGTQESPFLISDKDGLINITSDLSAFYRLTKDIDLEGVAFTPIGNSSLPFRGTLDGAGHEIRNLTLSTTGDYTGLFGYLNGAVVKNLALTGVDITSTKKYTGALAGYVSGGSISSCCAEGKVKGYQYVGGLIGYSTGSIVVSDNYALGEVTYTYNSANCYTGGLIGYSSATTVARCYAACHMGSYAKGLIGYAGGVTVEDSCYDSQVARIAGSNQYNTGKLTSALTRKAFFRSWDFEEIWDIKEGETYPYLRCRGKAGTQVDLDGITGGDGTEETPYLVSTARGLDSIRYDLTACYQLAEDIDLEGEAFTPIGSSSVSFMGTLDGAGHEIRNLTINVVGGYTGLFGYLSGAVVKNLALTGVDVTCAGSYKYIGALAGYVSGGNISCCSAEGKVRGYQYVGGLIGFGTGSIVVSDSYALGEVTYTYNSASCYTGGLLGFGNGKEPTVTRCYAACRVGSYAKGLIGYAGSMTVEDSYFDGQAAGMIGSDANNRAKLTIALTRKAFFQGWDFEEVWDIKEGETYPYLRCRKKEGSSAEPGIIMDGLGTEESPYLVSTVQGLDSIRYEMTGSYQLAEDIDLEGMAFTPIGNSSLPFRGTLDGAGHEIRSLTINVAGDYTGLFGYLSGAVVKNLALTDIEVTCTGSYKYVGGLAGYAVGGNISCCSMEGKVKGYQYVGGLIGYGTGSIVVSDNYALGEVTYTYNSASCYTGGLIGYSSAATVTRCYAACRAGSYAKGLIGYAGGVTVEDSCYDSQVVRIAGSDLYNTGKLTSALTRKTFFRSWDFEKVWDIKEGETYPYLRCRGKTGEQVDLGGITGGDGTEGSPYLISTAQGLDSIRYEMTGIFQLAEDIDLGGETFTPIGNNLSRFGGTLDGAGHEIRNLKVSTGGDYTGLFGYLDGAVVKNLALTGVDVTCAGSYKYIGALAGYVTGGNISCCSAEGKVKGYQYVGGLIGFGTGSIMVSDSYALGEVTYTYNSANCYTGGLLGFGNGKEPTVTRCYAACRVGSYAKGLIGYAGSMTVEDSYYDGQAAGMIGSDVNNRAKLTIALTRKAFFQGWDFEEVWDIKEGETYPYLRCRKKEGSSAEPGIIMDGLGTEESPYLVSTVQGLDSIRYEMTGIYQLAEDIGLEGMFTPIGNNSLPFRGTLDGAGHEIRNLTVSTAGDYTGLFGYLSGAVVKNLALTDVEVTCTGSYKYTGGLAGYASGGNISCCSMEGKVKGYQYVGGLIGYSTGSIVVSDNYALGEVTYTYNSASCYAGGLIGYSSATTVTRCYAACRAGSYAKGLLSYMSDVTVADSYYDGQAAEIASSDKYNICRMSFLLIKKEYFNNWDFERIWDIKEGETYPYLRCRGKAGKKVDLGGITGGDGTEERPYLVSAAQGLNSIRYDLSASYRLAEDIDLKGEVFTPIGNNSLPFKGTLDGAGHEISNLKVSTAGDYTGLFGYLSGAVVRNLALTGADVACAGSCKYTGGLAGYVSGGNISCCSMEGKVKGYQYVGGLVGYGTGSVVVSDSYALGEVAYTYNSSICYTGGLLGFGNGKEPTVTRCYAACRVGSFAKGLIGYATNITVEDSYYDGQAAEIAVSDKYNICRMTLMLIRKEYFKNWDFEEVWDIEEGETYPYLRCRGKAGKKVELGGITGGDGTEANPFHVSAAQGLDSIRYDLAAFYRLTEDIDFDGASIQPIGNNSTPFTGTLDGAGHEISNLNIELESSYTGLFGYLKEAVVKNLNLSKVKVSSTSSNTGGLAGYALNAEISDIVMKDVSVQASDNYTGGLVGYMNSSSVSDIIMKDIVTTVNKNYVSGLIGYARGGSITRCGVSGTVKGYQYVGGLLGFGTGSIVISDSYAMGDVTYTYNSTNCCTGGLVGYGSSAEITRCYAACRVGNYAKGLIGYADNTTVEDSYYDGQVARITGSDIYNIFRMTYMFTTIEYLINWDFEGVWDIKEGESYPFLRCRGEESTPANLGGITGGLGTEENPYLVGTAQGLDNIRCALSACYMLTDDIDFEGVTIQPIGNSSTPFTGILDGAGHEISGLKIETSVTYSGLFGYLKGAAVKNLKLSRSGVSSTSAYAGALAGRVDTSTLCGITLEGVEVSSTRSNAGGLTGYADKTEMQDIFLRNAIVQASDSYAGGLAGYMSGTLASDIIMKDMQTTAQNNYVGGLSGYMTGGSIGRCGVSGTVKGSRYVGGIAGYADGNAVVSDSYAVGEVTYTYTSSGVYTGGLIGSTKSAMVNRCYAACSLGRYAKGLVWECVTLTMEDSLYDSLTAGIGSTDEYNRGRLTAALIKKASYNGWDFKEVWDIKDGESYPYLRCRGEESTPVDTHGITGGFGTEESPYLVSTAQGLDSIRYELTACYRMTEDIDLEGLSMQPIGNNLTPFAGMLDGAGHEIRNLKINTNISYMGIFGYAEGATVRDLSITGVNIVSAGNYVGVLAGYMQNCIVDNCSVSGELSGNQYTGGLSGFINGGHIVGCNMQIDLSGNSYAGGLAGTITGNLLKIEECCVSGTINAASYLGGLIGSAGGGPQIADCYAVGSVSSTSKNNYTGGLIGYGSNITIHNCYASCVISSNGSGLVYVYSSSVTVNNSFFDSNVSGVITPNDQARTTEDMLRKETYVDWDWDDTWEYEDGNYPVLKRTRMLQEDPFELTYCKLTWFSAFIDWDDVRGAQEYEILYSDKMRKATKSQVVIDELLPDTDYELRVRAVLGNSTRRWSKKLTLRTRQVMSVNGLHSVNKTQDTMDLVWNTVADAARYVVTYNGSTIETNVNMCTLNGLYQDIPYEICVKAVFSDGGCVMSEPIVEKLYEINPQTDYAAEFITKCENQSWFIDAIEILLNLKGKCINTVRSQKDFSTIYAVDLTNRGISGRIPAAIGELSQLMYLYLANNDLGGKLPEELDSLDKIIEIDLSGNHFTK